MKYVYFFVDFICGLNNQTSMYNIHQFLLFALRLQFECDIDFPPVAFGDLVDVADSDVILLEPKLYGVADDVQLLRQRLVGDGCRLHGFTYEIQPLAGCLDGACRLFNDQPGAFISLIGTV